MNLNPFTSGNLLSSQDPRLIDAAVRLSDAVRSLPEDPSLRDVEPRVLIVGGFVRDAILGEHPKDMDLEVYGVSAVRLESLLNEMYQGRVNTVGRAFGVFKIHLDDDIEFDVSIPRSESKIGKGHKGFAVEGDPTMSTNEAAHRRDFTINAMAMDPLTGEIIDPFGGREDLRHRRLRVTDPERFQDDPLRVYRAIQFVARLGLTVDATTASLMREMVIRGDLNELAPERITEEMKKLLLKSDKPSVGMELARELGVIEKHFPEFHALIGCVQEPEWHPEGDVWIHTMMVLDHAARFAREPERQLSSDERLDVIFGALCHDLGKPLTTKMEDGRIRSRGHEAAGEAPTREVCARLSFSERTVESAVAIATQHLKPWTLRREVEKGGMTPAAYANSVRKLLKRIHPLSANAFLTATEADFRGRGIPGVETVPYEHGIVMRETIAQFQFDLDPTKPLLQGRDLIALGITPGPTMGAVIKHVESLRDEGMITTHEEAIKAAMTYAHSPTTKR